MAALAARRRARAAGESARGTPLNAARAPLPRLVWVLGGVSLLMDVSSEMIHSLLPLFLIGPLGASVAFVGLIEGVGESTALIVRLFSGALSDWLGRRKLLAVLGYALGAASKPLFALSGAPSAVLAARVTDRIGKGIRGAPRDALIADSTPPAQRGAAFGLRQSLDTVGAFIGPLLAVALLALGAGFRTVFWLAALPGLAAVLLLIVGVHEPRPAAPATSGQGVRGRGAFFTWRLPAAVWWVTGVGAVFTLARYSDAFLVLRARERGVPLSLVPLVMVAMNAVYAGSAYPFGRLADRMSRRALLALGLLVLIAANAALAVAVGWPMLMVGIVLWGVHLGLTQGLLAALLADAAPAHLRGTAFGVFNVVSGVAMLIASALAGALWAWRGPPFTFAAGAVLAAVALVSLAVPPPRASTA